MTHGLKKASLRILLALLSYGRSETLEKYSTSDLSNACDQIAVAVSGATQVFFPCAGIILLFLTLQSDG